MTAAAAARGLGLVTDRRRLAAAAGRPLADAAALLDAQVRAAADLGLAFVQLREPDLSGRDLLALTRRLLSIAGQRTRLLVNDRADVAAVSGAGVHLKQASIDAASLRSWLPPGTFVSRAVHRGDDVRQAGPVDALIAGTAAPTTSKAPGTATLGVAGLAALVAVATAPVYAIGGLTPRDWRWVRATGAAGLAAIGAFLPRDGESPDAAVARVVAACAAEID